MEDPPSSSLWRRVLRPSVVAALLSPVLLLVDIFLITLFILRQNWRAVFLTSVALLGVAQAIFWFSRALSAHRRQQQGLTPGDPEAPRDDPPSYEEVLKADAPPPPYYSVVSESPSTSYGDKGEDPSKTKSRSRTRRSRDVACVHEANRERAGSRSAPYAFTSPFVHEITNDEHSSSRDYQDPVEAIRTPVIGGANGFTTHLPAIDKHVSIATVR